MKTVCVRSLTLGEGIPVIAVPVTEKTAEGAARAAGLARDCADLIELRVDHFEGAADAKALTDLLRDVRGAADLPVLFTLRTAREGGALDCSEEVYEAIVSTAIESGLIDLVDVELAAAKAADLVRRAHEAGIPVILSQHDFGRTPESEAILRDLKAMEAMGGDVAKGAYMPRSEEDAGRILATTKEASGELGIPLILIGMGPLGRRTRIEGERWGSALTFASVSGKASAPGQIDASAMRQLLAEEHRRLAEEAL